MIDAKEATKAAAGFLSDLSGSGLLMPPRDLRLEEIELDDAEPIWRVTLSYVNEVPKDEIDPVTQSLSNLAFAPRKAPVGPRIYKVFEVVHADGTVRAMKIREPGARDRI